MVDEPMVLKNRILHYNWGSVTQIPELLGYDDTPGRPKAELWMGAHPKAPSQIHFQGKWESLKTLIERYPNEILGEHAARKFGNRLPFLFKVLAIETPLSIQVHPDSELARKGFEKENTQGVSLLSDKRSYLDEHAKPELICAYTDLWILAGFRQPQQIRATLIDLGINGLNTEALEGQDHGLSQAERLKRFFEDLITTNASKRTQIIRSAADAAGRRADHDPMCRWIAALRDRFPEDICVLAPVFLNLVKLSSGEAVYLPPRRLHCYLSGMGIELMSNSDNVIRCGLSQKFINTDELLSVVSYETPQFHPVEAQAASDHEWTYNAPSETFVMSKLVIPGDQVYHGRADRSAEILLCTDGRAAVCSDRKTVSLEIRKGQSALLPSASGRYRIGGGATLFKAAIPFTGLS
jgi:mannose-6-phosphate isomerase